MAYVLAMHPTNRVRELRKKAGLSQLDLAGATGVSQPAISQIENDRLPLTTDWMRSIARVVGCAPADLLSDADNPHRLSDEELELVGKYRSADDAQRAMVQRVAEPIKQYRVGARRDAA